MNLKDSIVMGGEPTGNRLVLYSDTKAGKTTTASQAPSPIFLGTDDGHRKLKVAGLDVPPTWEVFLEQMLMVSEEGPGAGYRTLVVDTLNGVADLCSEFVCRTQFGGRWADQKNGFLAWGGHSGWAAVSEEMKRLFPMMDKLVDHGWWVLLLAHQKVEKLSDPIEGDYDRFSPSLHRNVWSRFSAWADVILRISFDAGFEEDKSGKRRVICDGRRMLRCSATSAEVAGCRAGYELPATMPLAWSEIEERLGTPDEALLDRLAQLLAEMSPEDLEKAHDYLGIADDVSLELAPTYKVKTLIGRLAEAQNEE